MRQSVNQVFCLLVSFALFNVAAADEPIFTVQSSSTVRLLEVVQKLGLPDPITSTGLDSKATLDRLSDSISLNAPSGGFVFLTSERPQLVICLPLTNINTFMNALDAFASTAPVLASNGVYAIGKEDKFFAKQAGSFLLISDSPKFLGDAANTMLVRPWTNVKDDIKLIADFQRMLPAGKTQLVAELLSMTTTKPTAGLYLNGDSLKEHLRYGLQLFFAQSLFECRSFELALNAAENDEIRIQLNTQEDTTALRIPSAFQHSQANNASLAIDFTSRLSEANTQETLKWISSWEKELLSSIGDDSIQNRSDLDSTKRIVQFLSELVKQSVSNRKVDCYGSFGTDNDQSYLAGAVALVDSAKVAQQLTDALAAAKQLGLTYADLRANGNSTDSQADFLIDLPKNFAILGMKDDNAKLHVRVANQGLWLGIGNQSEQLRPLVIGGADKGLSPITVNCDLDADGGENGNANVLPFNFRKMKLSVQVTETGRQYDIAFGNLGPTSPTAPSVSSQAAAN